MQQPKGDRTLEETLHKPEGHHNGAYDRHLGLKPVAANEQAFRIHDLTASFRAIHWTGCPGQDKRQAPSEMRAIKRGVYVHYLRNEHEHAVHDRNGEAKGRGKLLIHPGLSTIKFGKFEDGLVKRRSDDAKHMHRREAGVAWQPGLRRPASPHVFAECIRLALVLDLSEYDRHVIRKAERMIRSRMLSFVTSYDLQVCNHRGDYRILTRAEPDSGRLVQDLAGWTHTQFNHIAACLLNEGCTR